MSISPLPKPHVRKTEFRKHSVNQGSVRPACRDTPERTAKLAEYAKWLTPSAYSAYSAVLIVFSRVDLGPFDWLDFPASAVENPFVTRVVIEHLTKVFTGPAGESIRAITDLNLAIEEGELLVLAGPSGCGKTTTLRLLAGLEQPCSGTISINGQVVNTLPPKDRDVAMAFQQPALYPHLSVYDNLAFGLKVRRCPRAEIVQRVAEVARMLNLTDCLSRAPMALSGGQRQRVAIGRALVRRPGLFLFDEPLSNLDPPMREQLRSELAGLHHQLDSTMIYVTHDQAEAMKLGDRVAVLRAGVLEQVAKPLEVYRHPANLFVAGFIGSPPMNFLAGQLLATGGGLFFESHDDGRTSPAGQVKFKVAEGMTGKLQPYAGKPVILGIRPEHIVTVVSGSGAQPDEAVAATVQSMESTGAEAFLRTAWNGQPLTARVPAEEGRNAGEQVRLRLDMRQAHFFDPITEKALLRP